MPAWQGAHVTLWDPYLDLGTGVLRNRLAITDPIVLAALEADFAAVRISQLCRTDVPGDYDLRHLQTFHHAIFGDVYDWAGDLRTVRMGKGAPFCAPHLLRAHGERIFAQLARRQWLRGLRRDEFVHDLAGLLGAINSLHPFRDGNGRAQRAFLGQLARAAGHEIRWSAMDPERNIDASAAAHRDGDLTPLTSLLDALVA